MELWKATGGWEKEIHNAKINPALEEERESGIVLSEVESHQEIVCLFEHNTLGFIHEEMNAENCQCAIKIFYPIMLWKGLKLHWPCLSREGIVIAGKPGLSWVEPSRKLAHRLWLHDLLEINQVKVVTFVVKLSCGNTIHILYPHLLEGVQPSWKHKKESSGWITFAFVAQYSHGFKSTKAQKLCYTVINASTKPK